MTSPAYEPPDPERRRHELPPLAPTPRRRVDWSAVTAVMSGLTALAAAVIAVATLSFVRSSVPTERPPAPMSASLESLWRLRDQWEREDMASLRSSAAAALLDRQANDDVDDVLFFFDEIAFLWKRGALDEELIWYEFYWPMANYWTASQDHVRTLRSDDATRLAALEELMKRLVVIEVRQRKKTEADAVPTAAQVRDFLNAEIEGDPCMEDDEDTHRVPT